jgi:hypothetical protein
MGFKDILEHELVGIVEKINGPSSNEEGPFDRRI